MDTVTKIYELLQKGRTKPVLKAIQEALDEGVEAEVILQEGLLKGMNEVGIQFKNEEIFVPEVLISARAMNKGVELLKPYLQNEENLVKGSVVLGTVQGDLHDIGKNLVRIMLESKGITVYDLGVDVPAEKFVEEAINHHVDIICCSALLTTTMAEMKKIVDLVKEKQLDVKVMIGGAPVNQAYCDQIGADAYTDDATSASEVAAKFIAEKGNA